MAEHIQGPLYYERIGRTGPVIAFVHPNPMDQSCWLYQFEALSKPDPDDLHSGIDCPAIILTGSEDGAHPRAAALQERIPGCELKILPGAGHACQLEQPWLFDRFMLEFLAKQGLFPGRALVAATV